jgi:glycosyltransferase involved in cell wall biosynthesis
VGLTTDTTVVIPVRNGAVWIDSCLRSVFEQTVAVAEVIVIDDNSEDESMALALSWSGKFQSLIVQANLGHGIVPALNQGISLASTEFIFRLDVDDRMSPFRIEEQLKILQRSDCVLVGSHYKICDCEGAIRGEKKVPMRGIEWQLRNVQSFFPHSSCAFKKSAFDKVGGYRDFFQRAQDLDLWLRLSRVGLLAVCDSFCVTIREHREQMSNKPSGLTQVEYALIGVVDHYLKSMIERELVPQSSFDLIAPTCQLNLIAKQVARSDYCSVIMMGARLRRKDIELTFSFLLRAIRFARFKIFGAWFVKKLAHAVIEDLKRCAA